MKKYAIDNNEFHNLVNKGYQVVDVRDESEIIIYGGYNPSINLPYSKIVNNVKKYFPDPEVKIIFICNYGNRSGIMANSLQKLGYEDALVLKDGLMNLRSL